MTMTLTTMSEEYIQAFTVSALQTALWADSMPDEDDAECTETGMDAGLARGYDLTDMETDSRIQFEDYCRDFCEANASDLADIDAGRAGHDFWLTAQGHGAGFWDGDYPEGIGTRLTESAKPYHFDSVWLTDDGVVIE